MHNIIITVFKLLPIMLALCLMLSETYYAQNYTGTIGGSLHTNHNNNYANHKLTI